MDVRCVVLAVVGASTLTAGRARVAVNGAREASPLLA